MYFLQHVDAEMLARVDDRGGVLAERLAVRRVRHLAPETARRRHEHDARGGEAAAQYAYQRFDGAAERVWRVVALVAERRVAVTVVVGAAEYDDDVAGQVELRRASAVVEVMARVAGRAALVCDACAADAVRVYAAESALAREHVVVAVFEVARAPALCYAVA